MEVPHFTLYVFPLIYIDVSLFDVSDIGVNDNPKVFGRIDDRNVG
jgi:hypothetical protein